MENQILLYTGSGLTVIWGIAHLFPTRSVVRDFGSISIDNKRILTMEWISEAVFLIFIGILCGGATLLDPSSPVSQYTYFLSAGFLIIMAIISLFTGFRIKFLPYKICPVIFTISAILLLLGSSI
jgi:hypothetical protein